MDSERHRRPELQAGLLAAIILAQASGGSHTPPPRPLTPEGEAERQKQIEENQKRWERRERKREEILRRRRMRKGRR